MDHARGRFVLLLNNDAIVPPLALDPEAGIVRCKLLNENETIQWSVEALPTPALFGARSIVSKLSPNNRFMERIPAAHRSDMTQPFVAGLVSAAGG